MANLRVRSLRRTIELLAGTISGHGPNLPVTSLLAGRSRARLYSPPDGERAPPLLFFHGGGFNACDLDTHDVLCRQLAAASGLRVLAIDYRLAPEHPAPAQLEDALDACCWALSEPAGLGGNSATIMVAGDSAGAYLAARCSLEFNRERRRIAGQLLLYPLLHMSRADWSIPSHPGRATGRLAIRLIQRDLGPFEYPSIFDFDLAAMPPTVIVSGRALDPVHADVATLVARLNAHDIPHAWQAYPRLIHGGLNLAGLSRSVEKIVDQAASTLRKLVTDTPLKR
jgi:acetyl esterase